MLKTCYKYLRFGLQVFDEGVVWLMFADMLHKRCMAGPYEHYLDVNDICCVEMVKISIRVFHGYKVKAGQFT